MVGTDQPVVLAAMSALSDTTATPYRLSRRLAGGETGAYEIAAPNGDRFVFKWETDPASQAARRRGARLTDVLRVGARWPVPQQQVIEHESWMFVIQEFLDGKPVESLSHALVDRLLQLHEQRLELPDTSPDDDHWPAELIRTLVSGGHGYCLHDSLRTYDRRTARLLERIQQIGRSVDPDELPGRDVVHWDWHAGNLLQSNGQLTAVIDTDFVTTGDARFDLVTLAVSSLTVPCAPGVRDRLRHAALSPLTDIQRSVYTGHLLLRILDWPIRGDRHEEIEFWLARADRLLRD